MLNGLNGGRVSENFTPQNGDGSSDHRPRLVLDTNTVLALWMFRDPKLEALRAWIEAGKCLLYSREDALEELRRVLEYRQFGLDAIRRESLFSQYVQRLTPNDGKARATAEDLASLPRCTDTEDQKFLEISAEHAATHLISRDRALLALSRKKLIAQRFSIMRPEAFLAQICS